MSRRGQLQEEQPVPNLVGVASASAYADSMPMANRGLWLRTGRVGALTMA